MSGPQPRQQVIVLLCSPMYYDGTNLWGKTTAAGGGYQSISNLSSIAVQMRKSFPSFGGVMLWDASQAYGKSRTLLPVDDFIIALP